MKKTFAILTILFICGWTNVKAGGDWAGSGTLVAPWQIISAADLATLATNVNTGTAYLGEYFKLMNDIDLSGYPNWDPIGKNAGSFFHGFFDGNNKKITGLTITGTTGYFGLFGYILSNCEIKNLTIENCAITATTEHVGALVGYVVHDDPLAAIRITNCHSSGSVEGNKYVGGLIGLIDVYTGTDGTDPDNNVFITSCSSSAVVSGIEVDCYIGGLIGFVGRMNETPLVSIGNCCATGNVSTNNKDGVTAGGLIGFCIYGSVTNCYAKGTVSATGTNSVAGGFMGVNSDSNIEKCFSTGAVNGSATNVLGFLGYLENSGINTSCYWNTETSGKATSAGGTGIVGKNTAEMKTQTTFDGWDFVTGPIWHINATDNDGYPHLAWQTFASAVPTITSFTPTTSGAGTVISITGTNFLNATDVSFGGTAAASFTVDDANTISAMVAGGTTGTVTVTTPGGTATSVGTFTFKPAFLTNLINTVASSLGGSTTDFN
jgi:hypothetical protein